MHTRTQQLRVAPDEKYSGCVCTFANQIKSIKLFKYHSETNASKYSLFELSTLNNSTYIDAHTDHFMGTTVFVALQPIKIETGMLSYRDYM